MCIVNVNFATWHVVEPSVDLKCKERGLSPKDHHTNLHISVTKTNKSSCGHKSPYFCNKEKDYYHADTNLHISETKTNKSSCEHKSPYFCNKRQKNARVSLQFKISVLKRNIFTSWRFDKSHFTNEEKEMSPNWDVIFARICVQIFRVLSKSAIWGIDIIKGKVS